MAHLRIEMGHSNKFSSPEGVQRADVITDRIILDERGWLRLAT
jgi:hypothetical protein